MRWTSYIASLLLALFASSAFARTVLVLPGGDLQFAMFFGLYESVRESPTTADDDLTLLGSCGGGVAAALIRAFPDVSDLRAFIESPLAHKIFLSIAVNPRRDGWISILKGLADVRAREALGLRPNLWADPLVLVPQTLQAADWPLLTTREWETLRAILDQPIDREGEPRLVIIAGEALYNSHTIDLTHTDTTAPYFVETFFTDSDTALRLRDTPSPVGALPDTHVAPMSAVQTGLTLWDALRSGMSDPVYIAPHTIAGATFITSAVDLHPIETAHRLGDRIIIPTPSRLSGVELDVIRPITGYDPNARLDAVRRSPLVDHWVDFSDSAALREQHGLGPSPSLTGIINRVPADFPTYLQKTRALWDYGYERGKASLR